MFIFLTEMCTLIVKKKWNIEEGSFKMDMSCGSAASSHANKANMSTHNAFIENSANVQGFITVSSSATSWGEDNIPRSTGPPKYPSPSTPVFINATVSL